MEVAIAEKDEYLKEMTEEKDRMMNEYLRFADMNVNLRGQLEELRQENAELHGRLQRRSGDQDDKVMEITRLEEELKLCQESMALWKKRVEEATNECNGKVKEHLDGVKFVMDHPNG